MKAKVIEVLDTGWCTHQSDREWAKIQLDCGILRIPTGSGGVPGGRGILKKYAPGREVELQEEIMYTQKRVLQEVGGMGQVIL